MLRFLTSMMRGLTIVLAAAVALTAPVSGTAQAEPAHLDRDFGQSGRLQIPKLFRYDPGWRLLPDGRILLIDDERMAAVLPDGRIDSAFGEGGYVSLQLPPNASAWISSVRVDTLGRLVVVASCTIPDNVQQGRNPIEDRPSQVLLERFTGDGRLDLNFGGGDGMALTNFDLPPAEPGLIPGVFPGSTALDPEGRIVIAGSRAADLVPSKNIRSRGFEPYVGRFTPDGEVDRSFADGGVLTLPGLRGPIGMGVDGQGNILLSAQENLGLVFNRLTSTGAPDPSFGEGGARRVQGGKEFRSNLLDFSALRPDGGILVSSRALGSYESHVRNGIGFKSLRGDGSLDRSFGRSGVAVFRFPRMVYGGVRLDAAGRILVAIDLRGPSHGEWWAARQVGIALARLSPDGGLDQGFARRGVLEIPFNGKCEVDIGGFQVLGDKLLIDATRWGKKGCRDEFVQVDLGS
jgi:uncharacterized delta-60 repeat protein